MRVVGAGIGKGRGGNRGVDRWEGGGGDRGRGKQVIYVHCIPICIVLGHKHHFCIVRMYSMPWRSRTRNSIYVQYLIGLNSYMQI